MIGCQGSARIYVRGWGLEIIRGRLFINLKSGGTCIFLMACQRGPTIFTTSIGGPGFFCNMFFFSKKCLKTHFFFYSNNMGFLDILLFNLKNLDLRKGGGIFCRDVISWTSLRGGTYFYDGLFITPLVGDQGFFVTSFPKKCLFFISGGFMTFYLN